MKNLSPTTKAFGITAGLVSFLIAIIILIWVYPQGFAIGFFSLIGIAGVFIITYEIYSYILKYFEGKNDKT